MVRLNSCIPTDLKEPSNETNHSHLWTYIGSNFVADDGVDDTVPPQNRNRQRGDCWLYGHRSYRENVGNGEITFGRAFLVGIGITLISCAFYVATWEIIYFKFMPDFMDNYGSHTIEKLRAAGATAEVIQAKINEFNQLKENYKNPLYNSALTFLEPFPVGLLITLTSAGILRKKRKVQIAATS